MSQLLQTDLGSSRHWVARELVRINAWLDGQGMPQIDVAGRLIRPVLSLAGADRYGLLKEPRSAASADPAKDTEEPQSRFWLAAAAVQMAHEASLIHDDILDDAPERRGESTLAREVGVKRALVRGDHLLTSAYRLAAATDSIQFAGRFARSVERTVAGEVAQARATGRILRFAEYEAIVGDKSGELLGCALAAGATLSGDPAAARLHALGRRIGIAYQMLDDLLDYLPGAASDKPAWQDYSHRHWTWPLGELGVTDFEAPVSEVAAAMLDRRSGSSVLDRCLATLEERLTVLEAEADREIGGSIVTALLGHWRDRARETVSAARGDAAPADAAGRSLSRRLASERWSGALERYARSFSFAARLFPAHQRRRVADVYAVCRFTDEIVDDANDADSAWAELEEWLQLCRGAYDGSTTGVAFVDRAMTDARRNGVPFGYLEELVEGMRMDLRGQHYETLRDLEDYSYRVASVVGLWLTRLFGVHDAAVLDRAAALGRAMQLTNILRDIGEDASRGRVYVPVEMLRGHGMTAADVHAMAAGAPLHQGWPALMEELIDAADRDYALAFEAMPHLPSFVARPVAVAAEVYRGIHDALRSNGFDNFSFRAHTSYVRKFRLALAGLRRLRRAGQLHAYVRDRVLQEPVPEAGTRDRNRPKARSVAGAG